MGYRSDVRILTTRKGFNCLKRYAIKHFTGDKSWITDEKKKAIYPMDCDIIYKNEKYIFVGWDSVKWYDSYADVKAVMDGLKYIAKKGHIYRYCRLGEEFGDFECHDNDDNDELEWLFPYQGIDEAPIEDFFNQTVDNAEEK